MKNSFIKFTMKQNYRSQFYGILDLILAEFNRRFQQATLQFLSKIEDTLFKSANGLPIVKESVKNFVKDYPEINSERLMSQLEVLPELLKMNNEKNASRNFSKMSKMSTFQMLLGEEFPLMKGFFQKS